MHNVTKNYQQGMDAFRDREYEEAIRILEAEPTTSPCFALALGNRGFALLLMGKAIQAEAVLNQVLLELDRSGCPHPPSSVQFVRNLGEALIQQGRYTESLQVFNHAGNLSIRLKEVYPELSLEIELENAHAQNSWGSALLLLGRYDAAIDLFGASRGVYQRCPNRNPVGHAEVLTNYAHALRQVGKRTEAELALREALDIAEAESHQDQIRRIQLALIQLNSPLIDPTRIYDIILEGADEAKAQGRFGTAYLRLSIFADRAAHLGDTKIGSDVLEMAASIEPLLDVRDITPAKLRMTKSMLLQQSGAPLLDQIRVLLEGAHIWFDRIAQPLILGDFSAITEVMHEHFRLLARGLLDSGNSRDALISFEAGRALAHSVEVDPKFLGRVVQNNPFTKYGDEICDDFLLQAQSSLSGNEVVLSIAVLPPGLVAFVVSPDTVTALEVPLPPNQSAREMLFQEIGAISDKLENHVGIRAIPDLILTLASAIQRQINNRVVSGIIPHSQLHDVPWRTVLHHLGIPWTQLRGGIEFGLFLRTQSLNIPPPKSCVTLGEGVVGAAPALISLCDEAREFAAAFGPHGRYVEPCTRDNVNLALLEDAVVLLSCHGEARSYSRDGQLVLLLADGPIPADSVFPDVVISSTVLLSACDSGVYRMGWGDFPVGAAPELLRAGVKFCVGSRFRLNAGFAKNFFILFAQRLSLGTSVVNAFSEASEALEGQGSDLWKDLSCLELLCGT